MRDPNRLYNFYDRLREVHITKFPDLRFGQFMMCVLRDMHSGGRDPFYVEDEEMIEYIRGYFK